MATFQLLIDTCEWWNMHGDVRIRNEIQHVRIILNYLTSPLRRTANTIIGLLCINFLDISSMASAMATPKRFSWLQLQRD